MKKSVKQPADKSEDELRDEIVTAAVLLHGLDHLPLVRETDTLYDDAYERLRKATKEYVEARGLK